MKYYSKNYLHFDKRISFDKVKNYVTNPSQIARHSFLPLIQYIYSFEKYVSKAPSNNRPIRTKERSIMYAGHLDNFIYKYYADYLNSHYYNYICKKLSIDECIIAYRNNKPRKSNIDFAAEVINQIVIYKESYIYIGDFANYFDRINHAILKENLKRVLNVNKIPSDWFNIYKSITKYGFYKKDFIESKIGREKYLRSQNKRSYFSSLKDFRDFQKVYGTNYNDKKFGIPQGTAISAVFANIYALGFDLKMKQIADKHFGIYRRYSDDFILILPIRKDVNEYQFIEKEIKDLAESYKIDIKDEKTNTFLYSNYEVVNLNNEDIRHMDYLGFNFDGKNVRMRSKSVYKFYRKAKKLINYAQSRKIERQLEVLPYRKSIYRLYTDLGETKKGRNSFIDYTKKAQIKFDYLSPYTNNMMLQQISNRKKKIEKLLGIQIHTER
ncbi:reverse transcriptase domain-containing protein [Staphylococcus equorum]|uniref:reverse transcriptase domain-containing protein n=1 Tax=Staphylococcus equorum TaxID=246432 RepID=UPI00070482E4|nr:reverse transcriptase domain-containing protein [Staphylococcus equorum]ALM58355.1 RNA-directed DNA polymerase [Staphylococcus equorum]MEB7788391.1 RNA-dependent DNA polymerase [Staphylococcus equorum]